MLISTAPMDDIAVAAVEAWTFLDVQKVACRFHCHECHCS